MTVLLPCNLILICFIQTLTLCNSKNTDLGIDFVFNTHTGRFYTFFSRDISI